ncbi:MAG: aspartate/glutamate racemase family protein [bacterium]|nr:aspartate/glutamate racemase family protein [bacterium]
MIGLFDSGSGGLSVLSALRVRAPDADIAYFGDIAHAPYGTRSAQELIELTKAGVAILKEMGATEIVSACNSVAASVLAGAASTTPVIEMTKPTAAGMRAYKGTRVLLIATPATVNSKIYENALSDIVDLDSLAISGLAGAIEFGAPGGEVAEIVREALRAKRGQTYEYLLLGCTHYPLALSTIEIEARNILGEIQCINPAGYVADEAVERFDCTGTGKLDFKISKDSEPFRVRVRALFPTARYTIECL